MQNFHIAGDLKEAMMANQWVYMFSEGNADQRNLLGGKGANLAEMTLLGMPVPQGFTVTTEACTRYYEDGEYPQWEDFDEDQGYYRGCHGYFYRDEIIEK